MADGVGIGNWIQQPGIRYFDISTKEFLRSEVKCEPRSGGKINVTEVLVTRTYALRTVHTERTG